MVEHATLFPGGIGLDCGSTLGPIEVAYERYGVSNGDGSNVVLVCHALSGGAHAASCDDAGAGPGWWDGMIGPGRVLDPARFCIVCSNVLGSCYGTTGPASRDPASGRRYGLDFPVVTIRDMVRAQKGLLDALGVRRLAAVCGGSMGGMQALAWAVLYPEMVDRVVAIATTDRHSPFQIALNEVARRAVTADPAWKQGAYAPGEGPAAGLALARMLGHVSYLSAEGMERKFGRRVRGGARGYTLAPEFEVECYLRHQGERFVRRFDANSLLYLTRAIDYFDLSEGSASLADALSAARARFLLVSFSSDWLYPPPQMERVAAALRAAGRDVVHCLLESDRGHDSFLVEHERQGAVIASFLRAGPSGVAGAGDASTVSGRIGSWPRRARWRDARPAAACTTGTRTPRS